MKHLRFFSIAWASVCLASLSGCSKKGEDSSAEPNTDTELSAQVPTKSIRESPKATSTIQSSTEGTLFKDVLALWEADQKDEAVKQFLSIQWSDPSVFQGIQAMNMSEQELRLLPQDEGMRIAGEAPILAIELRDLMFYVVSIGDKHASSGDIQIAKAHFEAVRLYGEALCQQPEALEIMRVIGKAFVNHGQKKLSEIEQ